MKNIAAKISISFMILMALNIAAPLATQAVQENNNTTVKTLNEVNQSLGNLFGKSLILIVPNEKGEFILEPYADYVKRAQSLKTKLDMSKDINERIKKLFSNNIAYENIILQIGKNVSYDYLHKNYLSVLEKIVSNNPAYQTSNKRFQYSLGFPVKGVDIKDKSFLKR